jgi:hypothetical protein
MSGDPVFYPLSTGDLDFRRLNLSRPPANGQNSVEDLQRLARTLAASSAWQEMVRAVFVIRRGETPGLALLGYFNAAQRIQIESLRWQLENLLPRILYVSYRQAEEDCEKLAERLLGRFGRQELRDFRFRPVPRGGFIVLGMLAYVLDLRPAQLAPSPPSDVPLVVTDDCAISGVRFSDMLNRCENRQVIFSHLYSHPDLRIAIERREPRVLACVSAQDLADHAPAYYGDEYEAWKERWRQRPNPGYWIGQPDHVCFSWNEPDTVFWNPVAEQAETAWRLLPLELCLKNRRRFAPEDERVQLQPEGKGPLRPSGKVVFGELEGRVIVANMETAQSFELADVAADMWRAIVEHGNLEDVEKTLAASYQVDGARLRDDLRGLVKDLREQGLLEEAGIQVSRD